MVVFNSECVFTQTRTCITIDLQNNPAYVRWKRRALVIISWRSCWVEITYQVFILALNCLFSFLIPQFQLLHIHIHANSDLEIWTFYAFTESFHHLCRHMGFCLQLDLPFGANSSAPSLLLPSTLWLQIQHGFCQRAKGCLTIADTSEPSWKEHCWEAFVLTDFCFDRVENRSHDTLHTCNISNLIQTFKQVNVGNLWS